MWRENVMRIDRVIDRFQFYQTLETSVRASRFGGPTNLTSYVPVFVLGAWVVLYIAFLFGSHIRIALA
jgi:hypothetical protein